MQQELDSLRQNFALLAKSAMSEISLLKQEKRYFGWYMFGCGLAVGSVASILFYMMTIVKSGAVVFIILVLIYFVIHRFCLSKL